MSKYEYTIMIADEVVDTRKSNREYEYAIACRRGPKWRARKLKELEDAISKAAGKLGSPTITSIEAESLQKYIIAWGSRHAEMQNWKDDWFVAGYCGNMALAQKAYAKEAKFIDGWGWDEVRIQPALKREIKKRV